MRYTPNQVLHQFLELPPHLILWLLWLVALCFVAPLFFLRERPSPAIAGLTWLGGSIVIGLSLASGVTRVTSVGHLLCWSPALVLALRALRDLESPPRATAFGRWLLAYTVTVTVSLVFDANDLLVYIRGARSLVSEPAPGVATMRWLLGTLLVMVLGAELRWLQAGRAGRRPPVGLRDPR